MKKSSETEHQNHLDSIIKRYNFLGYSGIYDFVVDTLLLGRDFRIRRNLLHSNIIKPGMSVLDAGSGTGRNIPILAPLVGSGGQIDAVDISSGMLEKARKRVARFTNVKVFESDILALNTTDRYDVICASYLFSVHPTPTILANHLLKMLKPDGHLLILEAICPSNISIPFQVLLRFEEWLAGANLSLDFSCLFPKDQTVLLYQYEAFSYIKGMHFKQVAAAQV